MVMPADATPQRTVDENDGLPAPLPSLDELLGIDGPEAESGDADRSVSEPDDQARRELDRELTGAEAEQEFEEAVRLMGDVADRIDPDFGLATQRLQEDVIRKLDMVISTAEQQQGGGSSSSSSSSSSSQRQQQQQQSPGEQGSQQAQGEESSQQQSEGEGEGEAGLRSDDTTARLADLAPDSAEWGGLPDRVRDALREASTDRFSSLYRRMTEAYYRRLAEEGSDR